MITITRASGVSSTAPIQISQTGAGIFFVKNVSNQDVALAQFLRISGGAAGPLELVFDPTDFSLVPIDLGPEGDEVFLVLFGTGIRLAGEVQAILNGENVTIFSFADAPGFFGLDQVNVGPIPRNFINGGTVTVQLRDCHRTSDSIYRYLRQDLVVPFSMEGIAFNVECGDLFIGDLEAGRVEV